MFILKRFFIVKVNSVNLKKRKISEGIFEKNFCILLFLANFFLVIFFYVMILKGKYEVGVLKNCIIYI